MMSIRVPLFLSVAVLVEKVSLNATRPVNTTGLGLTCVDVFGKHRNVQLPVLT